MTAVVAAGVDVGNQTGKAVVLDAGGRVLGKAVVTIADEADVVATETLRLALLQAGLTREDITAVVATGVGRNGVSFAQRALTDVSAAARGAVYLFPSARTVVDIGAEDARGLRCDPSGKALDFVMNDKCASGAGVFVEAMAKALEVSVDEMAALASQSRTDIDVNCTCAVFAESEVVSLIHRQIPRPDIARGILDSIAIRTASMLRRIGIQEDVVLIGGTARNAGLVDALQRRTGKRLLVPDDPFTVGALGAALYALDGVAQ